MKIFKRILTLNIILIVMIVTLTFYNLKTISTNSNTIDGGPIKVGVLLYNLDDTFVSILKQNLENIQKK